MRDSVGRYLDEIGAIPLLGADAERQLAQRIDDGRDAQGQLDAGERGRSLHTAMAEGRRAEDRFVRANLRLVASVAPALLRPRLDGAPRPDPGRQLLGLEHAVDTFDWRRASSSRHTPRSGSARPSAGR